MSNIETIRTQVDLLRLAAGKVETLASGASAIGLTALSDKLYIVMDMVDQANLAIREAVEDEMVESYRRSAEASENMVNAALAAAERSKGERPQSDR